MWDVNLTQKRIAITIILEGPAGASFQRHVRDAKTYDAVVHRLRKRQNIL